MQLVQFVQLIQIVQLVQLFRSTYAFEKDFLQKLTKGTRFDLLKMELIKMKLKKTINTYNFLIGCPWSLFQENFSGCPWPLKPVPKIHRKTFSTI